MLPVVTTTTAILPMSSRFLPSKQQRLSILLQLLFGWLAVLLWSSQSSFLFVHALSMSSIPPNTHNTLGDSSSSSSSSFSSSDSSSSSQEHWTLMMMIRNWLSICTHLQNPNLYEASAWAHGCATLSPYSTGHFKTNHKRKTTTPTTTTPTTSTTPIVV